ncbi:aerotaxis receptor Aer [Candidatus Tenderia electrophaga]|jgi:PAS domain S-box-containing protein|uniref:Aerotaxis receptor Aer n=1 Tax=Candidatus Tenderia electrophaga TaxID=1748243 RepID=A0A0S2TBM7_9GAMM|nr:aerotaxis receptor Aer [Candidatus Tenderia electrophaga]
MKDKSINPTDQERVMREDDFIVSKTDLSGKITYANRIFLEFAGYSEDQLLGMQHNIIRHPDMPRAVFKLLWDGIRQKQEIFAYVKNLASDGSFYWVFAHVTPDYDAMGNVSGYLSVRRKPRLDAIAVITDVYRRMLEIEKQRGVKQGMGDSTQFLLDLLDEKGASYEEFVLDLQG